MSEEKRPETDKVMLAPQVFRQELYPAEDGTNHYQAAGGVDEEASAQPETVKPNIRTDGPGNRATV